MALRLWAPLKPIMGPNVAVYPPENAQRNEQSETLYYIYTKLTQKKKM